MAIRVGTQPILKFYAGPNILPTWTPADFTNVQYWWTADAGVTESGGNVTAWTDQINSLVLTAVNNPQLTTSATLNGQNVIAFNGTNNYAYSTTSPAALSGADVTILGVYNLQGAGSSGTFMGVNEVTGAGGRLWVDTLSGNTRIFSDQMPSSPAAGVNIESPLTTGAKAIKLRYDSSAGDGYYAIDTLTESTFATGGTTGTTWRVNATVAMGATITSTGGSVFGGRYVPVEVAEEVFIYGTPSASEMTDWKTYVNNKYGTIIS